MINASSESRRSGGGCGPRRLRANARRLILATLATLCTVAGVLALTGASALAAGVRSEIGSFGPGGPGVGVFSKPQGVAVDQATGDVYVYDAGEEVDGEEVDGGIYKFNAAGAPEAFSSTATNVIKNVGDEAGEGKSEIAVDSSTGPDEGDIYVATREQVKIYAASGAEPHSVPLS